MLEVGTWAKRLDVSADVLSPAASEEEFRLHRAALEWSLADPIVIQSIDDVLSKADWREGFHPFQHQVKNLITFCRCLPVTLLADDVGLGKTISAALILCELMKRRRVSRALVLCPNILRHQWIEELESKVGIIGRTANGTALDRELRSSVPVVVTTYESARPRLARISQGDFDLIILDEAHKLRNLHGTARPPAVAAEIHRVLQQRLFKYVLMLTATPIQNRLWDLYSLIDCLTAAKGHKNPLGTRNEFAARYVADGQVGRRLRPGKQSEFQRILRQYLVRTRRKDARLAFPERHVEMFRVAPTAGEIALQRLLAEKISSFNGLTQSSLAVALMSSPEAFQSQLENMAVGNPTCAELLATVRSQLGKSSRSYSKQAGLLQIIDTLRRKRPTDWRLIVFTTRKETQIAIGELLAREHIAHGFIRGGQAEQNSRTIKAFAADPPGLSVVVSTDAGAEGINLQQCNVLVNYDLPWNPMVVEQRIGRIQRLASRHQHVMIFNLCVAGSPEERVVGRLMEKLQTISQTVGDIEAILESVYGDRNSEESMQSQIRDLVVRSLLGQNVDKATRMAEESMLEGKRLLREHEDLIDRHLGQLDEMHDSGPASPKLARTEPSTPYREFVIRSLLADKGTVRDEGNGLFEVNYPDRLSDKIAFEEHAWHQHTHTGVFMGRAPKLFVPGKPAFERLVQHWVDRAEHHFCDDYNEVSSKARDLAAGWLSGIDDAHLIEATFRPTSFHCSGTASVKVAATNAVDSYEKLLAVSLCETDSPLAHASFEQCSTREIPLNLKRVFRASMNNIAEEVVGDTDVAAFCRFYSARLSEELEKAGNNIDLRRKVIEDFSPHVHCDVVALEGVLVRSGNTEAVFSIEGHGPYSVTLRTTPATGEILEAPSTLPCEESGRCVPQGCLSPCAVTGKRVLSHLLVQSDETGRFGLKRLAITCEHSGKTSFPDEMAICEVTGRHVAMSLLQASDMSGRLALRDQLVACDFTGISVLPDELIVSEISGRRFRKDEQCHSAFSGIIGHTSEFITCELTGDWIKPEEAGFSSVSGRRIRKDLLIASDKDPQRQGAQSETVICDVTGKCLLSDEVARSDASGKVVDLDLLVQSDEGSGRALLEELIECEVSGWKVLPSQLAASNISDKRVRRSLLQESALSSRLGLEEEMTVCQITGTALLTDEVTTSAVSGRQFRIDEAVTSENSQRQGHKSEAVCCGHTGKTLLSDEVGESAISQRIVDRSLLAFSERSGRCGVDGTNEVVRCEATRKLLLADEVAICAATGKCVDAELFVKSCLSGRMVLPDAAVRCEVTGRLLLPDEIGMSSVSQRCGGRDLLLPSPLSGRVGFEGEFAVCEFTNLQVLVDELLTSDVSERRLRADHVVKSQVSGRQGHKSEAVVCAHTAITVLSDESGRSSISGKIVDSRLLIASENSGRLGIAETDEVVLCESTGKRLLADEVAVCQATQKTVDRQLLVRSAFSGKEMLPDEGVCCEVTGDLVLPIELAVSDLSGRRARRDVFHASSSSDRLGLSDEMATCEFTGSIVLADELVTSQASGKNFRSDQAASSQVSGKTGHRSEFVICEYSGRLALREETGESAITKRIALLDLLTASERSGRLGVAEAGEIVVCQESGRKLLRDEVGMSTVSGKTVDLSLLLPSALSGRRALLNELVECQVSGSRLLPDEVDRCCVTGKLVDARLLQRSAISNMLALLDLLQTCQETGKRVLPDELGRCEVSGKQLLYSELGDCAITGKRVHRRLLVKSDLSSRLLLRELRIVTQPDGRICAPDEVVTCSWTGYPIAAVDSFVCSWTGLTFLKQFRGVMGQLKAFEPVLKDRGAGTGAAELAPWLEQQANGALKRLLSVQYVESPNRKSYALVCDVQKLLGLSKQAAVFFVSTTNQQRIVGDITFLKVVDGRAVIASKVTGSDKGKRAE